MASEVFFNRVPHTQRRMPPQHPHDLFASAQASSSSGSSSTPATTDVQRSVGTTRSGGALTFPPLYLDPVDSHNTHDPASQPHNGNPATQQPGSFVLGSTFYHHPELNALVSNHLIDASANAQDGASGTGHAFLSSIFANRDGAHDDDSDTDEARANGADAAVAVPRPKITSEFVSLNEDLVPASLDMHGDMLPADQHPSYPFGNLFGPLGGMIAADSAIVGGAHGGSAGAAGSTSLGASLGDAAATLGLDFGGGLEGFVNLGQSSHGRRSAVSNAWNNFINKASRSKLVGSAGAHTDWNADVNRTTSTAAPAAAAAQSSATYGQDSGPSQADIIRSAKKLDLSPSLLFRTNTSTVLAPPTWPFRRHGPGCTSYAALLRPSSNIFGSSPASQAVAATLGGLPASSKIIKEVWSDLALEELVPLRVGETSAVRHLGNEQDELDADADTASGADKRSKKRRRSDPESDGVFAKRIASMEADPLDLLGPVSREIRGQAAQPWGTATSHRNDGRPRRRHRSAYSNQSDDEAAEAEHDDLDQGYPQRDRLRYSFALPPATFSWTESPEDDAEPDEASGVLHVEPDGIGWSTAKRIFVNEERDRLLPEVASRATGAGGAIEAYQIRGIRANQGMLPRPAWTWADGPAADADADAEGNVSFATELSGSTSHPTDLHAVADGERDQDEQQSVADSEEAYPHEDDQAEEQEWQQGQEDDAEDEDDAELQRALLMQYQASADSEADRASHGELYADDDVEDDDEDEEQVAEELEYEDAGASEQEDAAVLDEDEDVDSFGEAEDTA